MPLLYLHSHNNIIPGLEKERKGKTLYFEASVKEIRDATADELEHDHIHGPGCQH